MRFIRRDVLVGAMGALMAVLLVGAGSLVLRSEGIEFPDGSIQTTAYGSSIQLVGISTPASADLGFLGLTRKCHAEFGVETRMCTTAEVMRTVSVPANGAFLSGFGWVQPVAMGVAQNSTATGVVDISTAVATGPAQFNCAGWSTTTDNARGMVVTGISGESAGQLTSRTCDSGTGVACCG